MDTMTAMYAVTLCRHTNLNLRDIQSCTSKGIGRRGVGSFCREILGFSTMPCRPVPLLVHFWDMRCPYLSHFANIFLSHFISRNCGTSATTPFVLTPPGSCQEMACARCGARLLQPHLLLHLLPRLRGGALLRQRGHARRPARAPHCYSCFYYYQLILPYLKYQTMLPSYCYYYCYYCYYYYYYQMKTDISNDITLAYHLVLLSLLPTWACLPPSAPAARPPRPRARLTESP